MPLDERDELADKANTTEAVLALQHLEGERLDALQQALWAKAMEGDLAAVAAIVRIIQARCRLYGLSGEKSDLAAAKSRTVVISAEDVAKFHSSDRARFHS